MAEDLFDRLDDIEEFLIDRFRKDMEENDLARLATQRDDAVDLRLIRDIPYGSDDHPAHMLDIYYPKTAAAPLPVVVDIHGGGLFYGYKELNRYSNYEIARRGYAVVSINYRLIPDARFADQLCDVMLALSVLPKLAQTYPLDLERCSILGDSAGGLLAFMATVLCRNEKLRHWVGAVEPAVELRSVGLICVMVQTSGTISSSLINDYITNDTDADPFLLQPCKLISSDLPPFWVHTSEEDSFREDSLLFYEMLEAYGVPCALVDHPEGKERELGHVFPVCYPQYPESQLDIKSLCRFFEDPLKEITRINAAQ